MSTELSTARWVMTIEVRLKIHSPMYSKVEGLSASLKLDFKQSSSRAMSSFLKLASLSATHVQGGSEFSAISG